MPALNRGKIVMLLELCINKLKKEIGLDHIMSTWEIVDIGSPLFSTKKNKKSKTLMALMSKILPNPI
jgi:hypothetical protein